MSPSLIPSSSPPGYTADCAWPGAECAVFSGAEYFVLPPVNLGQLSASAGFSICTWFVLNSVVNFERVFDLGVGEADSNVFLSRRETTTELFLQYWSGRDQPSSYMYAMNGIINFPNPIVVGVWRHVCVVNQGRTWSMYDNGALSAASTASFSLPAVSLTSNYLARSNWVADQVSSMVGGLDDFRLFAKALSSNEVAAVFSNQGGA